MCSCLYFLFGTLYIDVLVLFRLGTYLRFSYILVDVFD